MRPDILIQNVSSQCIPNLVALKTFRPRLVVWVSTAQMRSQVKRLQRCAAGYVREQQVWQVDARDVESMHRAMLDGFAALPASGQIVYHLTGGTKSMALQGLYNLGTFRRKHRAEVQGVVMDPRTQGFDAIYPHAGNGFRQCAELDLDEMLAVHGVQWDGRHRRWSFAECASRRELLEQLRGTVAQFKREARLNDLRALHQRPPKDDFRHFRYLSGGVPKMLRGMLALLQDNGLLSGLRYPAPNEFAYTQPGLDVVKLLNGGWLEFWAGAVLHESGIAWRGAAASAKLLEPEGGSQEFDVLAAARNHLVYWSCKTDQKLTNDRLFEVDALRDGIAGADFHVAGLLHLAPMSGVMQAKAKRMNLHAVNAFADDAAEQLVRISGG